MARERYLRGVSEEELRPEPKQEVTFTPRSWLENVWYHHKVGILIGGLALIAWVFILVQTLTRVHPDYNAVMVTETALLPQEVDYLEGVLAEYGEDLNGDGKVVVQINNLYLGGKVNTNQNANAQSLQMQLVMGDTLLYLYEPMYAERLTAVGSDNAHCFLTELPLDTNGISEDKLSWNWAKHPRREQDVFLKEFPQDLCFGVRYAKPEDEKSAEQYAQAVALVKAFAADRKTAQ